MADDADADLLTTLFAECNTLRAENHALRREVRGIPCSAPGRC